MVAFARRSTAIYSRNDLLDPDEAYVFGELSPGERVCPPHYRSRSAAALRGLVLLLGIAAGCWMLLNDRASWPWWLDAATDLSRIERWLTEPDGQFASAVEGARSPAYEGSAAAPAGDPGEEIEPDRLAPAKAIAAMAPARAESAADVVTLDRAHEAADRLEAGPAEDLAALPDVQRPVGEQDAARLPPPEVDPDDPYQKRAVAVGLHPGLSRVVLERMSPADYRNAGIAIRKALRQSKDAEVVWPRQRTPELALFRVRFVTGAAPGCRRYVVTITKVGWTTTALPMENCGAATASPQAAG